MKTLKSRVEILLLTLAIFAVTAMITGASASQYSEQLLPISNIMLQVQEGSTTAARTGNSLSCAGKLESCSDQDCCVGYICAPASAFVPLPVCQPCGIATEDCYFGRACCPGFSCKLNFGALVGTCYMD